jgi:hypothetical protein
VISGGHDGWAIVREHRCPAPRNAVHAKELATLATIEKEFLRDRAPLEHAIAEAVYHCGKPNVPNMPDFLRRCGAAPERGRPYGTDGLQCFETFPFPQADPRAVIGTSSPVAGVI